MTKIPPISEQTILGDENVQVIGRDNVIQKIFNFLREDKSQVAQRHRRAMLKLVDSIWIRGVLQKSLYRETLIELGLEERLDAVERPWDMQLQMPDKPIRTLPPDTKVIDIFDESNGSLLILGEPGVGKTTILLELARDAIARAERDSNFPIPVVLNLSSWSDPKRTIFDWLQDELSTKYNISRDISQTWVLQGELSLLLDGLDEVKTEIREACIKAINGFRDEYGLLSLVVCCRVADYEALHTRLKLHGAILLKPLTIEQVDEYLEHIGSELSGVRQAVKSNLLLQELVQTPLMLNILVMAYTGNTTEPLAGKQFDSGDAWRKHLFNTYTNRMFERTGRTKHELYSRVQSIHWLTWLAQKMLLQQTTIFVPEQMNSWWLSSHRQYRFYEFLSRLLGRSLGVVVGIGVGFIWGERFGRYWNETIGYILGIILGSALGWWVGGLVFDTSEISDALKWSWKKGVTGFVAGLSLGFGFAIVGGWFNEITSGVIGGVIGALYVGIRQLRGPFIWSWKLAVIGLVAGIFIGTNLGGILWWKAMLFYGVVVGLSNGMSSDYIESITSPYQHFRLTLRNAITIGIGAGLVIGFILGWENGLWMGFVTWFSFGGDFLIRHFLLRIFLNKGGQTPWHYIRFLDYASERVLLRKVGGGYIFIHRMLAEHFTEIDISRDIQINNKDSWAIALRGETYWHMEKYEQALVEFDKAIQIDLKNAQIVAQRGRLYLEMGNYEQALVDFNRAINLKKGFEDAIYNRGITYRQMGKYDKALEDFNYLIEQGNVSILASRGEAYRSIGKYEQALADFDNAINHDPKYDWPYHRRGLTYQLIGRLEDAITDLSHAIELDPNDDWIYYMRSRVYKLKNLEEQFSMDIRHAIQISRSKYERNPRNWGNLFKLGLYELTVGNYEEAEYFYEEGLTSYTPKYAIQSSIDDLEEFCKLFPSYSKAETLLELLKEKLTEVSKTF